MKKYLSAFLMMLCIVLLCACGEQAESNGVAIDGATVQTPYAELTVPADYEDHVTTTVVSQEPYVLSFSAKDGTQLFTLSFGKESEDLLGTLKLDDQNVVIYAAFNELDKKNENYAAYSEYQDGINTILQGMIANNDFAAGEIIEYVDNSTFDIKTPVVTMKYPMRWKDKVQIDVSEEAVKFSSNGTKLFDLLFVECDGYLLGKYKDMPIYIVDYNVATDEEIAMQDDVNVILEHLTEDTSFVINH
ncbi:MAG: hypothetical protein Q3985_05265 [Eubacteriales bacterium]|nr:hypothetical protein [Eubacteriales bacterium]